MYITSLLARTPQRGIHLSITLLVVFLVGILATQDLRGQFRGSIQGVVTDTQGGVIPNAKVTLTNTDTNQTLTATSNGEGIYNFGALGAAHYRLVVEAANFQTKTMENVQIIPEQPNAINVQLDVAAAAQTVTVDASAQPLLDTETATIGGTISSNQIEHMPSFGRDVFQLTNLAAGTTGDQSQSAGGGSFELPGSQGPGGPGANTGIFATENGPQSQAAGQQYENNSISIDGISTVSAVWGGTSVVTPSEESVDNMKVVASGYDAESGRFAGEQIEVTSKSGTNTVHGSAFFQAWRPGLNAYQRYNGPASLAAGAPASRGLLRDEQRFNQLGGSVGGPFWKNRVFGFFAYETERNNSASTATGWYDTAAFRGMAPSGSIAATYLGFPGAAPASVGTIGVTCAEAGLTEGGNCVTVPGQGLNIGSPMKTALGTQDPTWTSPSNPGVGGGLAPGVADIAEYTTSNPQHVIDQQYNGRADANMGARDHLTFAIYWIPVDQTFYNGPARAYNLWHHSAINDAFSGVWNHTFTPNLLNEARANAAGWRWNEVASNPQAPFGLPYDSVGNLGSITLQQFGPPGPSIFNQWTYSYKDVATWAKGAHTVKFGGEWTRLYYLNEEAYNARPSFSFFNIWDFLNDAPQSENGTFDPGTGAPTLGRQDNRENLLGVFVQDDWKVMPALTVNLGLRYSYFSPLTSKEGNMYAARFGSGADRLTGMSVQKTSSLWHPQHLNFGPQFGFAWSPAYWNKRFVIRGGYGLNYNQEEIAISAQSYFNPGLFVQPSFTMGSPSSPNPGIVYAVSSDPHSLFGYPPNKNAVSTPGPNGLPATGPPVNVQAFEPNLPTMYTEHFSLDTESSLGAQFILTVGYEGSTARHTFFHYDGNAVASVQGIPLNPMVGSVNYWDNIGHGSYNAMLVGLRHQMAHSFMVDTQFTWGRSMDSSSAPYSEQDYPYDPSLNWGRSDYDINKQAKIFGMWQPVIFRNSRNWAEKIVGGWSLSGMFNWHTGFPWTPVFYSNVGSLYCDRCGYYQVLPAAYLGGAGHDYSNDAFKSGPGVGSGVNKNFPNAATAGNATAYFAPPALTAGVVFPATGGVPPQTPGIRRNSWTGPGYRDVDTTVSKNFGMPYWKREGAGIEVRADAFNLFNNLNFKPGGQSNGGGVADNISNPNFGQAQATLGARTVTLQARFQF